MNNIEIKKKSLRENDLQSRDKQTYLFDLQSLMTVFMLLTVGLVDGFNQTEIVKATRNINIIEGKKQ